MGVLRQVVRIGVFTLCLSLIAHGCSRIAPEMILSGPTMGTTYSISIVAPPPDIDRTKLQAIVDSVLRQVDLQMSGYRQDSEISRFNRSTAPDWFDVSNDVVTVVRAAHDVSEQSQGALDITVAPLVNLWGMGPEGEHPGLPDAEQIAKARGRVGYRHLQVRESPPALRKELPDLMVDLNSVAPGYAVDLLAGQLTALNISNFMIDIGGEVRVHGRNAKGESWRIAVERPVDAEPEPYAVMQLDNSSVTTSGEYRHYIVREGRRYSHTIDPRTGRPVEHALASVVVVRPTSLEADAWATALNVLGEEAGFELAQRQQIPAMFIVDHGGRLEHRMTRWFETYLVVAPH
jgi:FAD:protein FMN transferase